MHLLQHAKLRTEKELIKASSLILIRSTYKMGILIEECETMLEP